MLNNAQGPQNYNMANQVQNPNGMYLYNIFDKSYFCKLFGTPKKPNQFPLKWLCNSIVYLFILTYNNYFK